MPIINGVGRVGIRQYVAPVSSIWNGLTHYYNGDNTANDLKGTSHGTLVNGTTYGVGKINNCFDFDGINDYISFPTNTFKPTGDFSISFWIYKKNNNTAGYMSFTEIGQPYYGNGMFGYNYNGGFAFEINGGRDIVSSFIPNDTWTHIVITHKASTNYKIYTNGVLATPVSGNYPNTVNTSVNPNFSSNNIAMTINSVAGGGYVGATKFDEISLFDGTELTASQVAELYNSGTGLQYAAPTPSYPSSLKFFIDAGNQLSYPGSGTAVTDLTGNNNNGTLTNGASWSSSNNGVFTFDGVNDYIDVASLLPETTLTANDSFSVSVWFNPSTLPGGGANLFGRNNNDWGNQLIRTEGNVIRGGVQAVNQNGLVLTGVTPLSTNQWYMASYTYNGNTKTVNLYLNSSLEATGTNNNMSGNVFNANHVYIGQRVNDLFFQGKIGVVKFYLETRTDAQILADYNEFKSRYGL